MKCRNTFCRRTFHKKDKIAVLVIMNDREMAFCSPDCMSQSQDFRDAKKEHAKWEEEERILRINASRRVA